MLLGAGVVSIAVVWAGFRMSSPRSFLIFIGACWLITRGGMILLFPGFQLTGDERFFHEFVSRLVDAMANGQISTLSNSYDFPVWLARSFPFYLPLAAIFGAHDIIAARWLNVVLGAGQLVCLFFIARRLMGLRAARVACLLLLLFPYHCVNVLSYDPQVAGTFFLLIAVWMFLSQAAPRGAVASAQPQGLRCSFFVWRRTSAPFALPYGRGSADFVVHGRVLGRAFSLGLALLCAGVQRGGIDLLFVAIMLLMLLVNRTRNSIVCLTAIFLVWLPLRLGFDHWVAAQDANRLRTHTLGFMTRGWNLDTAGEYLPLYEQLDIASAQPEKQRTLEAILITEFARQPVRSLLVLTPIKIAKFFALGYASTAEQGLAVGGYIHSVRAYQILRSFYAPFLLILCLLGLIRCSKSGALQRRFFVPVLLIVMGCAAIVLIWETSPRYSHPIQFALLLLATAGLAGFSRPSQIFGIRPRFVLDFASSGAAIAFCWVMVSLCIVGVARSATNYQFLDPRAISALLEKKAVPVEPLHSFSSSWEGAIRLPAGTALPASVQISFPQPQIAGWDHLSVSIWLPDRTTGRDLCQVTRRTGQSSVAIPSAASGRISRLQVPRSGSLTLMITSTTGQTRTASSLRLGIGYALAN